MEILMGAVEQYYNPLLHIGVTNFNSDTNCENQFLDDYLTGFISQKGIS
jgi:hypothetical protein